MLVAFEVRNGAIHGVDAISPSRGETGRKGTVLVKAACGLLSLRVVMSNGALENHGVTRVQADLRLSLI